jgi:hypothetical protein
MFDSVQTMNHAESSPLTVNGMGPTAVKSPLLLNYTAIGFAFFGFIATGFLLSYISFIEQYILT